MFEFPTKEIFGAALDVAKSYLSKSIEAIRLPEQNNEEAGQKNMRSAFRSRAAAAEINVDSDQTLINIERHILHIRSWCASVKFKELSQPTNLKDIYTQLNTYLIPSARHSSKIERGNVRPIEDVIFSTPGNILVLGGPGAGKTTTMKKIMHLFVNENDRRFSQHCFPILIRCREIEVRNSSHDLIISELSRLFCYHMTPQIYCVTDDGADERYARSIEEAQMSSFLRYLDNLAPLIILDGFDEIYSTDAKQKLMKEVQEIARQTLSTRIIVTCRTGELSWPVEEFSEFEIAPLSWPQIEEFATRWIQDQDDCKKFLQAIKKSTFVDTAIKPLTLALLCAIYQRTKEIPDKPKAVYRRIVRLLVEEWDQQRTIARGHHQGFDADQKYDFLCSLAYYLSVELKKSTMSKGDIATAYAKLRRRFPSIEGGAVEIFHELESQTGLFVQSGYEQFEFSHKSLQEYLAAEYIVRMPAPPAQGKVVENLSSELAVAVSISSEPFAYLKNLIEHSFITNALKSEFYSAFLGRLYLENPDFEDDDAGYAVLLLFSLWFCRGKLPGSHKSSLVTQVRTVNDFNEIALESCPPVKEIIGERWQKFVAELLENYLVSKANVHHESVTSLLLRVGKSSMSPGFRERRLFRPEQFVLPRSFVEHNF